MGDEGGRPSMDMSQYGVMNAISSKLSTGSMLIDVFVAMLVPLLFSTLPRLQEQFDRLQESVKQWGEFTRLVDHTDKGAYWWSHNDTEPANNILQKAILMYVARDGNDKFIDRFNHAAYNLDKVGVAGIRPDDSDSECDSEEDYRHDARELHLFRVNTVPKEEHWEEVAPGVHFMRSVNILKGGEVGSKEKTRVMFYIRSRGLGARRRVDGFVAAAFEHYKERMTRQVDRSRYLYQPLHGKKASEEPEGLSYKRYKLSDDKTFDCVFHPIKDTLLKLVHDFTHRTGKYAIKGYPHKLGLLLHGPPGTGKTSLIKALATHTGRHVVSIPLEKIPTNQALYDVVFDQTFLVAGQDMPQKLPFKKVIFIFEDIDAAGSVVQRRDSSAPAGPDAAALRALQARMTPTTAAGTPGDADDADEAEEGEASSSDAAPGSGGKKKKGGAGMLAAMSWLEDADKLNLAGLLNVLDGVVDTPERIIIMTSNHPEQLDPALVRPGRIDFKVYMGRIHLPEALQMVRHYYAAAPGGVSDGDVALFSRVWRDDALTPAELEMLCANFDSLRELIHALAEKLGTSGALEAAEGLRSHAVAESDTEEAEEEGWELTEAVKPPPTGEPAMAGRMWSGAAAA